MVFTAPAKLNLYLKVKERRDDGYHEIETLFEKISIFDKIFVEPSQKRTTISCNNPCVPTASESLLGQTVRAFKKKSGKDLYFRISLEKNIPIGAGLGGGSSDAAALLKGLNRITGSPLDERTMLEISRQLGADVPFFIGDFSFGLGKGRGDIVQRVKTSLDLWHILVNPPFEVLTKEVYGKVSDFGLTKKNGLDRMFTAFVRDNNINSLVKNLCNDLQAIVLRNFPVLEEVFSELRNSGAKGVLLTGSGPTVFGIFDREKIIRAAERMRKIFPVEKNWQIFIAQTYRTT